MAPPAAIARTARLRPGRPSCRQTATTAATPAAATTTNPLARVSAAAAASTASSTSRRRVGPHRSTRAISSSTAVVRATISASL